ncbi:MAG: 4Fe-4S dicluster domain-containing protein [Actinomycetota bacterium]
MARPDREVFYPILGQTKWSRLKKSLLVWDPLTRFVKKLGNVPVIGPRVTWFWDEEHFNQTVIPINRELSDDGSVVLPVTIVEEMVRRSCHTVKMNLCLCRSACACERFPMGLGCLFMGASTKNIHPSMGRPVPVEEALEHVRAAVDAGLVMHIGKVDPDPYMLGLRDRKHFLTLCFCCQCCCVAMKDFDYFAPEVRARTHRLEGLEVTVTDECNGCARCVSECYAGAMVMQDGRARVTEGCKGCGLCVARCPRGAIEISITDGDRMVAEALERITHHSDVT